MAKTARGKFEEAVAQEQRIYATRIFLAQQHKKHAKVGFAARVECLLKSQVWQTAVQANGWGFKDAESYERWLLMD